MHKALILIPDESIIKNSFAIQNWWLHILPCSTVEDLHDFADFAAQYKIRLYLYFDRSLLPYIDPTIKKHNLDIEYIFKKSSGQAFDVDQVIDDCYSELAKIKRENIKCLCNNKMAFGQEQPRVYAILRAHKVRSYDGYYQLKKIIQDDIDEDE
jgi:hypothetical protein